MLTRKKNISILVVVCLASLPSTTRLTADDWPQWQGPDRTNVSRESNLRESWPDGGPPQVWLFRDGGLGYSGPAIVGDRLYILGARDEAEQLICLSAADGTELWSAKIGKVLSNGWGDGPRGTPTVDGDRVYVLGGEGDLACVQADDGSIVWTVRLQDFGGAIPNWGYTESVLVDGSRVICTPGGEQGAVLALDKRTGDKLWQSDEFTEGAQYASIGVSELNGLRQYIQLTQKSLVGINAENGRLVWRTDWPGQTAVIPTPLVSGNDIYVTSGYGVGCNLFHVGTDNQVSATYDDAARKVMKNQHGGVVRVGDYLYGYSDSAGWVCQEWQTGKQVWRERERLGKGALTCADGKLYCLTEEEGIVALVSATPDGWSEISRFTLTPQTELRSPRGRIWTHPVVANGRLYLRDQELLFCFDVRRPAQ